MLSGSRVVCGAAATALHVVSTGGLTLTVKNTHASDALVLGDSTVTAATGFSLAAGATQQFKVAAGDRMYGIRGAAADITAHVMVS